MTAAGKKQNGPPRPVAAFDLDGTFYRWSLSIQLLDEMVKRGYLPERRTESLKGPREEWMRRERSYTDFINLYVKMLDEGLLRDVSAEAMRAVARDVVRQYGSRVYVFTRELSATLRERDYVLVAISGSPIEIVEVFCEQWGFDHFLGTREEVGADGFYTGNRAATDFPVYRKEQEFRRFIREYGKHPASVAVGDTFGDAAMLKAARYPIAFNPDPELMREAIAKGHGVVEERKNKAVCTRRLAGARLHRFLPPPVADRLTERLLAAGVTPFPER